MDTLQARREARLHQLWWSKRAPDWVREQEMKFRAFRPGAWKALGLPGGEKYLAAMGGGVTVHTYKGRFGCQHRSYYGKAVVCLDGQEFLAVGFPCEGGCDNWTREGRIEFYPI